MRAFEVALFLVMVAASFTIISGLQVFEDDVVPIDESMFSSYTVDSLSNFPVSPSPLDYFFLMVVLIVDSIKWAITLLFSIVIFYPYLMVSLDIPTLLAIPLNAGLFFIFAIAIVQIWRSFSIDIMR